MVSLLMTVGTGHTNSETRRSSLSHGLAFAIDRHRPGQLVFFGSDQSKKTVKEIKEEFLEMTGKALPTYKFVEIHEIDSITACIRAMDEEVRAIKGRKQIDYTSGTKTMTAAAAIVATLHHVPLYIVEADRGKDSNGISGTERIREQTLFPVYDHILCEKAVREFNAYRFESAIHTLKDTVVLEEKEKYLRIFEGYAAWDRFDHEGAFKILGDLKDDRISMNKAFLGKLTRKNDLKQKAPMQLADLVANAQRRIEERKYDDATARLYRAVELVAQIHLLNHGVDDISKNLRVDDLRTYLSAADMEECHQKAKDNGALLLGVRDKYALLQKMGCANAWVEYETVMGFLTKRNTSILAHGLTPVDREFVSGFYDRVLTLAKSACGKLEFGKELENATFMKL